MLSSSLLVTTVAEQMCFISADISRSTDKSTAQLSLVLNKTNKDNKSL
jgi:hypothetical protein